MGRIATTFEGLRARGEAALVPYLMAGYPSMEATREMLHAVVEAGADLVELGIPFSDPLADGATLQRVNHLALEGGATLRGALELVASLRDEVRVPLVLMSYYNPLLRMGDEAFAREAALAGVDGVIVPDLPVEEAAGLGAACAEAGVDLVGMATPGTPPARLADIAARASGFLYCVSLKGVTGARSRLSSGAEPLVRRVREVSDLPAVVGFGISTADQVRAVAAYADGVVVASALLDRIDREPHRRTEAAAAFVAELKAACHGARGT
jgi:tryptophan synthase alpha chain